MAEFVELRAEEWIAELEQMERIRMFEPKEIKSIAIKRREFEYKIQRRTKCKEDFLKYIQYEIDLHRIIKARRKKIGIEAKKAEIEYSQSHRIANLFKQALFKFQDDVKLWMSFFKFCESVKYHSLVSQMLVRMLQIHTNKADLWVFAAKWELEQCKSVNSARQFLIKGLRHHPSSVMLYEELLKVELVHIKQKQKEIKEKKEKDENFIPDEVTAGIVKGNVMEVVYQSAIKAIPGVDFKVSLLNILKGKRAENFKEKIFQDIVKNHLNEELTWDVIAKREFEGSSFDLNQLIERDTQTEIDEVKQKKDVSERDKIQRSIHVYEEAVKKFNSVKMWSFYLDFVIKLNENVESLPVFKMKLLNHAMEGAMASNNMPEKYFLRWISVLQKMKDKSQKLSEVLTKGTEQHPNSLELWYAHVKFYLSCDQEVMGIQLFNKAVQNVTNSAPIWSLLIKYLMQKSSPKVEETFINGINSGGEIAQTLKPLYIEWLVQAKGIVEARQTFESSGMNLPPCLELYKKMADIELCQAQPCLEKVRRCHELACANFGKNNAGVWLDYIKFELKKGEPSKVTKIHRRALKTLVSEQVDAFVSEFNSFKLSMTV